MHNINQLVQQTADESQDAILIADLAGIIRYWNAGAERILGYTAAEAIGQSLDLFILRDCAADTGRDIIG